MDVLTFFARDDFGFLLQALENIDHPLNLFNPTKVWFYRPVSQQFYFWSNYKLFGLNAFSYHSVNIFFHLLSSILVYRISKILYLKFVDYRRTTLVTKCSLLTTILWGLSTT